MADFLSTDLGDCAWSANIDVQATARSAAFFGSYLPSFLAVVFFSTPRLRQQWAFRILIFALIISIGKGIFDLRITQFYGDELHRSELPFLELWNTLHMVSFFLLWTVPWICDCALLCKLLAFRPAQSTPGQKRAAVMAFPLAMHISRVPLLVASYSLILNMPSDLEATKDTAPFIGNQLLATEGALQAAQNCYCSSFLLYKAHQFAQADYAASNQRAQRARLGLRYFTESILFTFLPASVLQVGWLVLALIADYDGRLQRADTYFRMFNVMFSINFGLLAVWWSTARIHALEVGQTGSQLTTGAPKQHALPRDMSLLDWAIGPLESEDNRATRDEAICAARSSAAEEQGVEKDKAALRGRRQSDE